MRLVMNAKYVCAGGGYADESVRPAILCPVRIDLSDATLRCTRRQDNVCCHQAKREVGGEEAPQQVDRLALIVLIFTFAIHAHGACNLRGGHRHGCNYHINSVL